MGRSIADAREERALTHGKEHGQQCARPLVPRVLATAFRRQPGTRTTVTVHSASATTLAETLPR